MVARHAVESAARDAPAKSERVKRRFGAADSLDGAGWPPIRMPDEVHRPFVDRTARLPNTAFAETKRRSIAYFSKSLRLAICAA